MYFTWMNHASQISNECWNLISVYILYLAQQEIGMHNVNLWFQLNMLNLPIKSHKIYNFRTKIYDLFFSLFAIIIVQISWMGSYIKCIHLYCCNWIYILMDWTISYIQWLFDRCGIYTYTLTIFPPLSNELRIINR